MTVCFVDVETGGVDPRKHPLIQFAAIACTDSYDPIEEFEIKLAFDRVLADPVALQMNSYDELAWQDAVDPRVGVARIKDFLRRHATFEQMSKAGRPYTVAQVIAHRADFDMDFLRALFADPGAQVGKRLAPGARGEFLPAYPLPLCTLQLAQWTFRVRGEKAPKNWKLGTLAEHFGIDTTGAHDALADVRMAREIAVRCTAMLAGRRV